MIQKIEGNNLVSTNQLKFIKYFLIVILSIGLYFTWLQKDKFEANVEKLKEKTSKLKEKIKKLKQDLQSSKKIITEENRTINIVLPDIKSDYSKIIPTIDYKDLHLKITKTKPIEDDMKITPNITLDDENKINKVELKIETKF